MTIMKCKMCGGTLKLLEGSRIAQCEYCGTRQTVPGPGSEQELAMFARAGELLQACEFDRAAGIYESLAAASPQEAEAYWGLVLCKYGIEYVDDPGTGRKVPTCHRSSYDSVLRDTNFKLACSHADPEARALYEQEAAFLEDLRKDILSVSSLEAPYDIFLCYKESEEDGRRTRDSVLAQDLYQTLTKEGWRVFFSRISLEDKLGTAYEPYIFAALRSARLMIVLGTSRAHLESVWVRNEWSRFLLLMETDAKKYLIPCYEAMDPYELPEEFSRLQAQDLGKVGAVQDLLWGAQKLLARKAEKTAAPAGPSVASLLDRGRLFLEDRDWNSADDYFDRVLDMDPRYAPAYVGKFCVARQVRSLRALETADLSPAEIQADKNVQKALRFGDSAVQGDFAALFAALEERQLTERYHKAAAAEAEAKTPEALLQAAAQWEALGNFRDAADRAALCRKKADALAEEARRLEEEKRQQEEARRLRREEEKRRRQEEKRRRRAALLETRTKNQKPAEEAPAPRSGSKAPVLGAVALGTVVLAGALLVKPVILPRIHYRDAQALLEAGQYTEAQTVFQALGSFGDSVDQALLCRYHQAEALLQQQDFAGAEAIFRDLGDFMDSAERVRQLTAEVQEEAPPAGEKTAEDALPTEASELSLGQALLEQHHLTEAYGHLKAAGEAGQAVLDAFWKKTLPGPSTLAAGYNHTVGLRTDGTVLAAGHNDEGQSSVRRWTDVMAIDAYGDYNTIGLRTDGTLLVAGNNECGQRNVQDWSDLIAADVGSRHTVGLRSDGTVLAVGDNHYGQCNVEDWTDVTAISAGWGLTVGLKSDGTVLAAGENSDGQCNVEDWTDMVAIAAGNGFTLGLRADGTVLAAGSISNACADWTDVIAIDVCNAAFAGLRADGTVLSPVFRVAGWTDVTAIAVGFYHIAGLRADGTVLDSSYDVKDWTDVVDLAVGWEHTVGLRSDGTVLATGYKHPNACNVGSWTEIRQPARAQTEENK